MYGHYFLTSIGVKNAPWRPYITTMQLAQFLCIAAQSTAAWAYGSNCGFADCKPSDGCRWHLGCILPRVPATIVRTGHKLVMIGYMVTMMGLFANFFINSYLLRQTFL